LPLIGALLSTRRWESIFENGALRLLLARKAAASGFDKRTTPVLSTNNTRFEFDTMKLLTVSLLESQPSEAKFPPGS
jgi:hypothetical protein